jgi:hypothetical protein
VTVGELIEKLKTYSPTVELASYYNSEYWAVADSDLKVVSLFDNGGYLSHPYREEDKPKLREFLVIG